jgi:L-asparaginase II
VSPIPLVRVVRSDLDESVHFGDVAVVDASGEIVAWAGDPDVLLFARSSMKPLQATVSLSFAPFHFQPGEIAVMCASHNAEPVHVEAVGALLNRAGVPESSLQCPAVRPWDEETAASRPARATINSDCSGKHAGMLAACVAQGWSMDSYRSPDHPLQQAVLRTVLLVTGLPEVRVGVDGCGVPVHGMRLRDVARIYARMGDPPAWGDAEPHVRQAISAMLAEPYLVAGRNRVDTAVMQTAEGVVVKGGAEGLLCAAVPERGIGIAVKVRDGSARASGPAIIRTLIHLGVLNDEAAKALASFARPPVLGGGKPVGELVADFSLERS